MIGKKEILFDVMVDFSNIRHVEEAIRRAKCKLPGKYSIVKIVGKK